MRCSFLNLKLASQSSSFTFILRIVRHFSFSIFDFACYIGREGLPLVRFSFFFFFFFLALFLFANPIQTKRNKNNINITVLISVSVRACLFWGPTEATRKQFNGNSHPGTERPLFAVGVGSEEGCKKHCLSFVAVRAR